MSAKFSAVVVLFVCCISAFSQTQPTPAPPPKQEPTPTGKVEKKKYEDLVEQAKKSDPNLDFTALRIGFYESKNYNPNAPMMTYRPLWGALAQQNYPEAIKIAQSVFEKNFVEINAHLVAQAAYRESGDTEHAKFHKYMADGLLASIKGKNDGKTKETAFHVISINEEYGLMRTMSLRPIKQALVEDKGHFFDAITVVDPQTNAESILFFNIDRIFNKEK